MKPIEFEQANTRLLPPEGEEENVLPLPIWTDGKAVLSKWSMTWRERLWVLRHGVVYLHCVGRTHPPLAPMAEDVWHQEPKEWSGRQKVAFILAFSTLMWGVVGLVLWGLYLIMTGGIYGTH
jgi:hypothetical protein